MKELGLTTWDDLLNYILGENNRDKYKYKGHVGLKRAIEKLKKIKEKHKKIPISVDKGIPEIYNTIQSGEWKNFGINSWNDLLMHVFGEIHYDKNKHQGKEGLNKAIKVLKEFKKEFGRIPASNSQGIYTIYNNARNGICKEFGINNWNDLLKTAFGTINKERNKYIGKEGLVRAKKELLQFEKKNGKIPTSKNQGMNTIYTTARLGKWNDFGIKSWRDLLDYAFNI